ncbi:C6 zinc finger domain protein [Penicillium sp. IBT 18751x]|nr:C6 zinc finger domain protein [Penicillium sp. IBT 18751x]
MPHRCRTCRIRKVKCDEQKHNVNGQDEPQCQRCSSARLRCEWKGGPIPRKSASASVSSSSPSDQLQRNHLDGADLSLLVRKRQAFEQASNAAKPPLLPSQRLSSANPDQSIQAANSLTLSAFDRSCLSYLQNSTLVVILGKHWPWSTISYAYQKIAVKEPMVMSMILASTAREIHRSRLFDEDNASSSPSKNESNELDGRMHYGRALSSLRHALKQDVKTPQKIEAVFITLWLMIDYENRFGSGITAINIHIRGIETLLHNHIVPLLQNATAPQGSSPATPAVAIASEGLSPDPQTQPNEHMSITGSTRTGESKEIALREPLDSLRSTSVPLFLLWTLYFFTPSALFFGPNTTRLDTDIYQFFLNAENGNADHLSLPELYRICRQSPARFWGENYPMSAQLDDMENLPGLTLYHHSHVIQFKITELFQQGELDNTSSAKSPYQQLIDQLNTLSIEYDTVLMTAKSSASCDVTADRRVLETVYWSAITFYSTIVFFHICFQGILNKHPGTQVHSNLMTLCDAVSQVLELSLKLHRSRPRLMIRIIWPLFLAGIATSDQIYQDWVAIQLRELGRFGENYTRISRRFDEIIQGSQPYSHRDFQLNFTRP